MTEAEMLQQIANKQAEIFQNVWVSNVLAVVGRLMEIGIAISLAMIYQLKVRMYRMQLDTMAMVRDIRDRRRGAD